MQIKIEGIIPTLTPIAFERALTGYQSDERLADGEVKIDNEAMKSVLVAALFLGSLNYLVEKGYDWDNTKGLLTSSLLNTEDLNETNLKKIEQLLSAFFEFRIIREEHAFDDWLCEVWWEHFQSSVYTYPSAMSNAISYILSFKEVLNKCEIIDS
jgi:hypothetical protein